jgi:subtilase family serine protease
VLPDVSMEADSYTGLIVGITRGTPVTRHTADGGITFDLTGGRYGYMMVGGTSLACPLFSATEALAIQSSGSALGFANPALYRQYGTPSFHDVQPNPAALGGHEPSFGLNTDQGPLLVREDQDTSLRTAKGFDDVTGVGSPTQAFITWFKAHPTGQ